MHSAPPLPVLDRCWAEVGVWGDRSCPKLTSVKHCHHCPTFADTARKFLERPVPENYGQDHARAIAEPRVAGERRDLSVLVFELGEELLSLDTKSVVEAVEPRPVHRVTRRSNSVFRGLVNVHGQLELLASLRGLFGLGPDEAATRPSARMLVLSAQATRWVVSVDRIVAVTRYGQSDFRAAPSLASGSAMANQHVQRVIRDGERNIGYLEMAPLLAALDRSLQ